MGRRKAFRIQVFSKGRWRTFDKTYNSAESYLIVKNALMKWRRVRIIKGKRVLIKF